MKRCRFVCVESSCRSRMADVPGRRRLEGAVPDPEELDPARFRAVRDEIRRSVRELRGA